MTTSIESEVETQILNAITTAGVTGLNLYGGDRRNAKLLPYVYADVEITAERFKQYTGVFACTANIRYTDRADTSSNASFDSKFQEIVQAFYTDPKIADQMTSASTSVTFYVANIRNITPIVTSPVRTWSREIVMDLEVTSKQT
jgi:hypothetical protein